MFAVIKSNSQSLSKLCIIYEHKDQIVLSNGKQYQIVLDKPFYEVTDKTIKPFKESNEHVLRLNRVLTLRNKLESLELIEWVKGNNITLYRSRKLTDHINKPNEK